MALRTIPMPPRVPQIVQALYEQHVDLAEGTDDQRRALQTLICEQARFELGAEWGAKNAGGGRPRSKDAIACLTGGVLYAADCFTGGTRKPSVPARLEELPGQVFEPVEPINHLGAAPVPAPQPVPDDLVAAIMDLQTRMSDLEKTLADDFAVWRDMDNRVDALEQKPLPKLRVTGDTSRAFAHSHKINLEVVPE